MRIGDWAGHLREVRQIYSFYQDEFKKIKFSD